VHGIAAARRERAVADGDGDEDAVHRPRLTAREGASRARSNRQRQLHLPHAENPHRGPTVRAVSYQHRGLALGVALRRAYGAALYLESDYPGIADRVDAVIDAVPSDDVSTSRSWMAFSIVVRRSCLGLPFSEGDTYTDHAIWML